MAPRKNSTSNTLFEETHNYYVNKESRIIYLHGEYDQEEPGVDFRMASTFIKNLDLLNSINNNLITIKSSTFGGCWNYGMMIFDAIKLSPSETTIECFAHSRSMSSIIPQAATYRYIAKHADFMIHYGTYGDEGDQRKVFSGVKHHLRTNELMFNIYVDRCINGQFAKEKGFDKKQLYKFLKDKVDQNVDWWLDAESAVYYGFMDGVL